MADYKIMVTSAISFNCAINSALQASEDQFTSMREKMNCLQEEFELNVSKGLNSMKENSLKISLKNDELKNELGNKVKENENIRTENNVLKAKTDLVNSFVESWKAKNENIDLNNNGSISAECSEHDNSLDMHMEALEKENNELREQNAIVLSENQGQLETIAKVQTQANEYREAHKIFVGIELESKKMQLNETKLLESNSKLKAQMQALKQTITESENNGKVQTSLKQVGEQVAKAGSGCQKPKKESHSRRTQRILKSKLTEMNEKIVDTERCLEKYADAFSENQDLNVRANELQEENDVLKMELDLVKAKLEEIEALAEKGVCKNAKLLSRFDMIENEKFGLKAQLDEANDKLIRQLSQRKNNSVAALEDDQKIPNEVQQINQMKKEKSFMLAQIKKIQVQFLKMIKSGSWISGYHNTVEITATLPEVTEMVNAFNQFA